MAKAFPYFRWFPADAEGDDFYASLTDAEGWTYHRLLNRSWLNEGIPSDLDELAKVLGKTRAYIDRVWPKLRKRWVASPNNSEKLVNPRQEEERTHAQSKSERATESIRTRYERRTNELPRARARADSDSVYGSSEGKESEENQRQPKLRRYSAAWKSDSSFAKFALDYLSTGASLIDNDFAEAYELSWKRLDFEQKLDRIAGFNRHAAEYRAAPAYVPRPLKFLETEWERPPKPLNGAAVPPQPERSIYKQTKIDDNGNIVEIQ
jgi:hypothetical protein